MCEEVNGDSFGEDVGGRFVDELFLLSNERLRKTQKEKRERRKHGLERAKDQWRPEELRQLQETNDTIAGVAEGVGFFKWEGSLYHRWLLHGQPEGSEIEQLVLPKQCQRPLLELAHAIPLAGYLGKKKTASRIMKRFYWPTLFRDTADFCQNCPECQKAVRRKVSRAPLIPLPGIEEPFKQVAMDIVGPLPKC